ncbi:unnamed protein product, partial [Bubo scandiacus]
IEAVSCGASPGTSLNSFGRGAKKGWGRRRAGGGPASPSAVARPVGLRGGLGGRSPSALRRGWGGG